MTLLMLRVFFLILCVMGSWSISQLEDQWAQHPVIAILIGLVGGGAFIGIDKLLKGFSLRGLSAATFGILTGFTISYFIGNSVLFKFIDDEPKLIAQIRTLHVAIEPYLRVYRHHAKKSRSAGEAHRVLVNALAAGDVRAAEEAMRDHVLGTAPLLASFLRETQFDLRRSAVPGHSHRAAT